MHSTTKKHARVAAEIRKLITHSALSEGDRLPTEIELAQRYRVCPVTVHKAMSALVASGVVVRSRGRGTFVAPKKLDASRSPNMSPRRIGFLCCESVTAASLSSSVYRQSLAGALDSLNVRAEPDLFDVDALGSSRVTWSSSDGLSRVIALGEPLKGLNRHPLIESVIQGAFDGLITFGVWDEPWLRVMLSLGIPTVITDFPNETLLELADHISVDPRLGYVQAVRFLHERKCRNVHFVGQMLGPSIENIPNNKANLLQQRMLGATLNPDSLLRLEAVRGAMWQHGSDIPRERIHFILDEQVPGLIETLTSDSPDRPDAVICHNISVADRIAKESAQRGKPIIAVGAQGGGELYSGPAYCIQADLQKMGRTAIDLLVSRLAMPGRQCFETTVPTWFTEQVAINHKTASVAGVMP